MPGELTDCKADDDDEEDQRSHSNPMGHLYKARNKLSISIEFPCHTAINNSYKKRGKNPLKWLE